MNIMSIMNNMAGIDWKWLATARNGLTWLEYAMVCADDDYYDDDDDDDGSIQVTR